MDSIDIKNIICDKIKEYGYQKLIKHVQVIKLPDQKNRFVCYFLNKQFQDIGMFCCHLIDVDESDDGIVFENLLSIDYSHISLTTITKVFEFMKKMTENLQEVDNEIL